jgi:hypothetical protein
VSGVTNEVVFRTRRIRRVAIPVAVVLVAAFAVAGALLPDSHTGAHSGPSDQVAMIAIGVLLALGVLWFLRPRVRADAEGVEVRNLLTPRYFPWSSIRGVRFPEGAVWARLDLPADEYVPVTAIQAADGERAVAAMRELRARYRAATQAAAQPGGGLVQHAPGE